MVFMLNHRDGWPSLQAVNPFLAEALNNTQTREVRTAKTRSSFSNPFGSQQSKPLIRSKGFLGALIGIGAVGVAYVGTQLSNGPEITQHVYLEFDREGEPMGRVVIGLYGKNFPEPAENFHGLVTGDAGHGYQGSPVHRAVCKYTIMCGDITHGDGSGGCGYKKSSFKPDTPAITVGTLSRIMAPNTVVPAARGSVCMLKDDKGEVRSQFLIACMKMPNAVNDALVPVGQVVQGIDVVEAISCTAVDASHRPVQKVHITSAGICDNWASTQAGTTTS